MPAATLSNRSKRYDWPPFRAKRELSNACFASIAGLEFASARFVGAFETAPNYRLYAMAESDPPKPALVHGDRGAAIKVEFYELDHAAFDSFLAEVPAPLAIGTVTLTDNTSVKGSVAGPRATRGAEDITELGGWRAYIARGKS